MDYTEQNRQGEEGKKGKKTPAKQKQTAHTHSPKMGEGIRETSAERRRLWAASAQGPDGSEGAPRRQRTEAP